MSLGATGWVELDLDGVVAGVATIVSLRGSNRVPRLLFGRKHLGTLGAGCGGSVLERYIGSTQLSFWYFRQVSLSY